MVVFVPIFIYAPDAIMLDLEDSVTMAEKDAARLLVYNALKTIDYGNIEMVVRINPLNTPYGKKDIEAVVKAGVHVVRMPKTETADEVREVEREIERVEQEIGCLGRTQIMAAIESALGIVNAYEIAVFLAGSLQALSKLGSNHVAATYTLNSLDDTSTYIALGKFLFPSLQIVDRKIGYVTIVIDWCDDFWIICYLYGKGCSAVECFF